MLLRGTRICPARKLSGGAAATAAYTTLAALLPSQEPELDAEYSASLARIADDPGREAGVAVGKQVAAEMLARRAGDRANMSKPYRPFTSPGVYVPTTLPLAPNWGDVTPWAIERGSQFRPGPPPPLTSEQWARDYNDQDVRREEHPHAALTNR
jgi:hypothetical protein